MLAYPSTIKRYIERDNEKSLLELQKMLTKEIRSLKQKKRYYEKNYGSNVSQDVFNLAFESKFGDVDAQIETLKTVRSQIMRRKKGENINPQFYKLFNLRKEQKLINKQNKKNKTTFKEVLAIVSSEQVEETFRRMFYQGQFLGLSEDVLQKFDFLFNKLGLGLTNYIKKAIQKEYSAWASDVAYEYIDQWVSDAQAKILQSEEITESDLQQMIELLEILKQNMGY